MLRIDPDFHAYVPALSEEERAQLEENLVAEGCRDPLVVWGDVIVDGHNRFEICSRLNIPFQTVEKDFADRDAALDWMDANQLGRRNLTPDQRRLLLGRRYNRLKGSREDNLVQNAPNRQSDGSGETTAARIAKEHGVSERTVERAGELAQAVEADPDLKAAIDAGRSVASVKRDRRAQEPEPEPQAAPEEPADPLAKLRKEIGRLTDEAKIDEILGLREDLADAKLEAIKLREERDDLKAKLKEATQGDLGRALGIAQRRADTERGRAQEHMATIKRMERKIARLEARIRELEDTPIPMGAP